MEFMELTTYPLNNVDYAAEDAELYHCTRTSGIYGGEDFQISITGADHCVTLGPGLGWIRDSKFSGKAVALREAATLDFGVSDAVYPRIDAAIIRYSAVTGKTGVTVKQGVAASSPAAPALVQTEAEYELHLCHVLRPAGSAVITASNVTDLRMDPKYCGLMADSVTHVDTATIEAQIEGLVKKLSRAVAAVQGGAGFLSKTVIWTKESGGTFPAQELSVSMSGYDGVELVYTFKDGSAMTRTTGFLPLVGSREAVLSDGDLLTHFMRSVEFGDDVVKFGPCSMQAQDGSATESNDHLIPLVIYGVTGVLDGSEESGNDLSQGIFLAEYGVTTNQEVYDAKTEGRVCYATNGTVTLPMTKCDDTGSAVFSSILDCEEQRFIVDAEGWTEETVPMAKKPFRIWNIGTATLDDIVAALREGKICYLVQSGYYLPLTQYDGVSAVFSGDIDSNYHMTFIVTADGWTTNVHDIRRKVTEISAKSDDNQIPTAKAVYAHGKPLLLDAEAAETYLADSSYGDAALEALLAGRKIEVKVPNADGGNYTAIYSPVLMSQVPNYANQYLYLFFLRDEKQDLSSLLGQPDGTVVMPTYGQLKMLLSQEYNEDPLAAAAE